MHTFDKLIILGRYEWIFLDVGWELTGSPRELGSVQTNSPICEIRPQCHNTLNKANAPFSIAALNKKIINEQMNKIVSIVRLKKLLS